MTVLYGTSESIKLNFTDDDPNDILTLDLGMNNGSAVPSFLEYN